MGCARVLHRWTVRRWAITSAAVGRRGDHIVGPGEFSIPANRIVIGVFPGMAISMPTRYAQPVRGWRTILLPIREEGAAFVALLSVSSSYRQPDRQSKVNRRHTDDRTAQALSPCVTRPQAAHTGDHDTGNRAPVAPGLVVGRFGHPEEADTDRTRRPHLPAGGAPARPVISREAHCAARWMGEQRMTFELITAATPSAADPQVVALGDVVVNTTRKLVPT